MVLHVPVSLSLSLSSFSFPVSISFMFSLPNSLSIPLFSSLTLSCFVPHFSYRLLTLYLIFLFLSTVFFLIPLYLCLFISHPFSPFSIFCLLTNAIFYCKERGKKFPQFLRCHFCTLVTHFAKFSLLKFGRGHAKRGEQPPKDRAASWRSPHLTS